MTPDVTEQSADEVRDPFDGADWTPSGYGSGVRRRRRVSLRRLRRRRRAGLVLLVFGGAIVFVFAWLLVTGLLARHELAQARADVHTLHARIVAGDLAGAQSAADRFSAHAERAHLLTTGPIWAGLANLPGGAPLQTVRVMTTQFDALGGEVVPDLVAASKGLDPVSLRLPDGRIDLSRISEVAPRLDSALRRIDTVAAAVAARPAHGWLHPVDSARAQMVAQLDDVRHTLRSADLAAHIAPALLGQGGVRRYFVAFQNEAEARGTGGIPGAFAILRADNGKVSFERFEPDTPMLYTPVNVDLGAGYNSLFRGANTTTYYVNTNLSPHFPYAARLWLAMWQQRSGERLDGAIAVDPTVLSYLLKVTGPARLPNGGRVTSQNIVALTQSTVYAMFPRRDQNAARKAYLLEVARAVSAKLVATRADATQLLRAGATAAGQRRVLVYSTDPAVERLLAQTALSGEVPVTRAPYAGLSVVNDGGNKLDYYLDRSLRWQAIGCGARRTVQVTIKLHNNAPASGLSPYVTARSDDHTYPVRPGDNREEISYYATAGAVLNAVTVDKSAASAQLADDRGHPVFTLDVEVPRGHTTTVVLSLTEPATGVRPIVLDQPLIRPLSVEVDDARCT